MIKKFAVILAIIVNLALMRSTASAQTVIIPVETAHLVLLLQTDKENELHTTYFGDKLSDTREYGKAASAYTPSGDYTGLYNAAYSVSGSRGLLEPALSVSHADGNNSLDLKYIRHQLTRTDQNVSLLQVWLKDPVYDFEVVLNYKIYAREDVIEQWSEITHHEKNNVILQKYASANLYLQAGSYYLRQYHGDWAHEMQPEETALTHGIKTIDSKLGTRANLFEPSVFMISLDKPASEDEGKVLYGALEWSGNFRVDFELDPLDNLKIVAGINNFASAYQLKPGETFITPPFLFTFSNTGKGDASRKLQRWARNYKLLNGKGTRLTLLNNWESTYFDFNETKLRELLKNTKDLGVDLFLLDDGWFGNNYPRNNDRAGLGDWQENAKKLPNGIGTIIKEAKKEGVKFGIWIEPEMVNPKSDLYHQHPDWVIKQPGRPEYYFRNQLVLDLSNPQVQQFVFGIVDSLFIKNPELAYIKWDCNAVIYNAYSSYLKKDQSQFYIEYMRGLYHILQEIRKKYPDIPMMLCSGGGGRVDYNALQYFTEYWPSDNTDPLERIFIQWEYSYFYPAMASANHVTDWGKQPLKFRVDVAMMGKLGFDIVTSKLSAIDLEFCRNAVRTYDTLKPIIWQGDQYRLANPASSSVACMMYVDTTKTSAVVFNYLVNYRFGQGNRLPVLMKGLDPKKKYSVREVNLYPGASTAINGEDIYSGEYLMKIGLLPELDSQKMSSVFYILESKKP